MDINLINWIYDELDKNGWTQKKLTQVSGINKSTLTRILKNNIKTPQVHTIRQLEKSFGSQFLSTDSQRVDGAMNESLLKQSVLVEQSYICIDCSKKIKLNQSTLIKVPETVNEYLVVCSNCESLESAEFGLGHKEALKYLLSKYSQTQIAKKIGVKDSTVYRVKSNTEANFSDKAIKNLHVIYRRELTSLTYKVRRQLDIINEWGGCAVTGLENKNLIDVVYVRCEVESKNENILTINNSLPLSALIYRLFDHGLISFNTDGYLIISKELNQSDRKAININTEMKLSKPLSIDLKSRLLWHKENIFKP